MNVRFLEAAARELDEAIAYYDSEVQGLGKAFLTETLAALDRINGSPTLGTVCPSTPADADYDGFHMA